MPGPYTYYPNIPASPDIPAQSQAQIQANFGNIMNIIDVDHDDFTLPTAGQHKKVTFPVQAAAPLPFAAGTVGLYNLLNANTGINELTLNKFNQAIAVQIPITASILSVNSAPTILNQTWSYLPSGILLVSGTASGAVGGANFIDIPSGGADGFPGYTIITSVIVNPYNSNISVYLTGITGVAHPNRFTFNASGAGNIIYLALGF